jgi:uncharacterized protein (TIGR02594 family)
MEDRLAGKGCEMNLNRTKIRKIQRALVAKGFDPGPIDGMMGPKTERAIVAFKKSVGLRPRPFVGPVTFGALVEDRPPQRKISKNEPPWLRNARSYIGLKEFKGSSDNPKILKWWRLIKASFKDDETPWCAGFVGGTLEEVGMRSSRSAMARSYEGWGMPLGEPAVGCVVTFWRGKSKAKSRGKGHVAYVVGKDRRGRLMCLGGNQGDAVNVKAFGSNRVTSYRWPSNSEQRPHFELPQIASDGTVSQDEA